MWQILFTKLPHIRLREIKTCQTSSHLQAECITAALECFLTELKTIRQECEDPEEAIDFTQEFLEEHIEKRQEAAKNGVSVRDELTRSWKRCRRWRVSLFFTGVNLGRLPLWELAPEAPGRASDWDGKRSAACAVCSLSVIQPELTQASNLSWGRRGRSWRTYRCQRRPHWMWTLPETI